VNADFIAATCHHRHFGASSAYVVAENTSCHALECYDRRRAMLFITTSFRIFFRLQGDIIIEDRLLVPRRSS